MSATRSGLLTTTAALLALAAWLPRDAAANEAAEPAMPSDSADQTDVTSSGPTVPATTADASSLHAADAPARGPSSGDADAAALDLADALPVQSSSAAGHPYKYFVQDAVRESGYRDAPSSLRNQLSFDVMYQQAIVPSVNVNVSARFEHFIFQFLQDYLMETSRDGSYIVSL
ncbi:hypothetical protein J8I87_38450 [Paraburkholderia sp. LEh10]|uniref:hypothetical protein n=1 Tax=Paraburkholderia sp. LEh10 TaxID=2821353 RepID=UPI001AE40ECD|nr:hypothetical protein [Paraburkholderia sp. LEh10]MBP0595428.1 hypothetical protein [Paraburkholderia sp. LEh10]